MIRDENLNNTQKLKIRASILIFVVLLISAFTVFYLFYDFEQNRLKSISKEYLTKITNSFELNREKHLERHYLEVVKTFISEDLLEAMDSKDRERIKELTLEKYLELKKNDPYISVMHFHYNNGKTALSLHNLELYGDNTASKRELISKTHKEKKTISGFEQGASSFSYRNVIPLFYKNSYVGAFEIGVSPSKVLDFVTHFNRLDGVIKFDKQNDFILFQNMTQNPQFLKIAPIEKRNYEESELINKEGEYFAIYSYDILDIGGNFIGEFLFFQDLKNYYEEFKDALTKMIFVLFFSGIILFFVLNYIFSLFTRGIALEKERLSSIIEGANVGTWEWDLTSGEIIFSEKSVEMIGYKHKEISPITLDAWMSFIHPDDLETSKQSLQKCFSKESEYYEAKCRMKNRDGHYIWVLGRGKVIEWSSEGKPLKMAGTHANITHEELLKQEIEKNKEILKELFENMRSGLVVYEPFNDGEDFIFKDINKASMDMEGVDKKDIIGKKVSEVFPGVKDMGLFDVFVEVYKSGKPKNHPISLYHDNRISAYRENFVYKLSNGEIVATYDDLTEKKRSEEALKEAKDKAEQASKAKSEFLANMSHEIRTPMNAVIGLSDLLVDMNLEERQKDMVKKINSSSKMLLGIINDILDYSKIEVGSLELEHKRFELDDVLSQLKIMFVEQARKKEIGFDFSIEKEIPKSFIGDELRLTQVLTNLLSNAIKFTHQGSVCLTITLLKKISEREALLGFEITDSGIGISSAQLKKLFLPFSQADSSTTRKYGGSGLGLVITKKIIEAMGGTIKVESTMDRGSKFSFETTFEVGFWEDTKALKNDTDDENTFLPRENHSLGLEKITVLLVEDNEINQQVASMLLQKVGVKVEIANNGKEGVEKYRAKKEEIDLVLMDVQMPIMSGYEASLEIRKFDKDVPIIALTAAAMVEDIEKAKNAGMNDHLSKPINKERLYSSIAKHCKLEY